jgi:uncharacterized protein YecE (DUF72 family)
VRLLVGTSGFAFPEWKGVFYPQDLKSDEMLGYYATRYPTVEINNTFYRLPKESVLQQWASQVPDGFSLAIKASRRITHFARLKPESADALGFLLQNSATLGSRLGPIPPDMQKNIERLRGFLALLPAGRRFTMEFRHESWFDDEVMDALRERDVALCVSEQDDFSGAARATATWGYLRLHRMEYDASALAQWRAFVAAQAWTDAYVYFKHDHADGSGPPAADAFLSAGG